MLSQEMKDLIGIASGPPTDLAKLSESLGVVEVERKEMRVEGMVLPKGPGFKVILNSKSIAVRARFSWAHELGHIIDQSGLLAKPQFRSAPLSHKKTEELCDKIAAEILMPREEFKEYMDRSEETLAAVHKLASVFDTSILSTAIRYTDLLEVPAVLSVWKVMSNGLTFSWPHRNDLCRSWRFDIPKGRRAKGTGWRGPHMALESSGVVSSEEPFLVTRRSRGGEVHRWQRFPTESMGIGSYENRYVLSLSYVEVPGAGKAKRRETPN